ncbi:MAG: nucleotidyltransferase domain-containing protein [Candidatus Bathyarchaeota archaeon]|nr:nucleotidyltransferase domain-containing protein [Candidatus Bathyarchaeota archaeon]
MVLKVTEKGLGVLSLYRTDYAVNLHVREMAKLLDISHVTLLPHLNKLESEKILKSETSGRNKQYLLNPENALTKNYLIITEELATIEYLNQNFLLKKLATHLHALDFLSPIVLFGSQVKGYATKESDIDLFSMDKLTNKQTDHIEKFQKTFGKKISIKTSTPENFNSGLQTGDILIKEIVADHIILCNPDAFVSALWRQYVERQ